MTEKKISVVLPVYNEAANIGQCLAGLYSALRGEEHEILICYDFDGDDTLPAVEAMPDRPPTVKLVKNDLGKGVAFAMKAGFAAASGDVIVTTMADLSDPPEVIMAMARKIREEGAAVVSGSRYMKGGRQEGGPLLKGLMSRFAGLSLYWIAGVGTHDATTNFRAYSSEFLKCAKIESVNGFEIALELTVKAHVGGYAVTEVPSTWIDRVSGYSRFNVLKLLPSYLRWYWLAMHKVLPTSYEVLLFFLLTLSLFFIPSHVVPDRLDDSWAAALNYFFMNGWDCGTDYVFTFGPLGLFYSPHFHPDLFYITIFWEFFAKGVLAVLILHAARRLTSSLSRFAFLSSCFLFINFSGDSQYFLIVTLSILILIRMKPRFTLTHLLLLFLISTISLVKFTFYILAVSDLIILALFFAFSKERRFALIPLAMFTLFTFIVWLGLGQSLLGYFYHIRNSISISGSYSEAMATFSGSSTDITYALFSMLFALVSFLILTAFNVERCKSALSNVPVILFIFLSWKHGFVRHDLHCLCFFTSAVISPFLFMKFKLPVYRRALATVSLSLLFIVSLVGLRDVYKSIDQHLSVLLLQSPKSCLDKLSFLINLEESRKRMSEEKLALDGGYSLPRIRSSVGFSTIDMIDHAQGVLISNELLYHPRPVFQSYCAYNDHLLKLNMNHYMGKSAPQYVLYRHTYIDNRYPSLEHTSVWTTLYRNYRPIMQENGFILLEKTDNSAADLRINGEMSYTLNFNQALDIPPQYRSCVMLEVDMKYSIYGSLRKIIYKSPEISLFVETTDGDIHKYRYIPAMGKSGFIVSPLLENQMDFLYRYFNYPRKDVKRLWFETSSSGLSSYKHTISVKMMAIENIFPEKEIDRGFPLGNIFNEFPVSMCGNCTFMKIDCMEVIQVHAPGEVRFEIGPGKYVLKGYFGIASEAYMRGNTDGVLFAVFIEDGSNKKELFNRTLKPLTIAEDRGKQELMITFECKERSSLYLLTETLETGNWDWSYFTGVEIISHE